MNKIACFTFALGVSIIPAISHAQGWGGSSGDIVQKPKAAGVPQFSSLRPSDQWMPYRNGDPRSDWGYGTELGVVLMADELGDKLSELGRASMVDRCFEYREDTIANWIICGSDAKLFDAKKLEAELDAGGVKGEDKARIVQDATAAHEKAMKVGAEVEAAAKSDPGLTKVLKLADDAKAEWATYLGKHKAEFDRYLAYKDGVRTSKSNDPAFAGCFEATKEPFAKLVKATAPKIPWDVGNDQLPGYMNYLENSTEAYITTVNWAACAWSVDPAGEATYVAAANQYTGRVRAGWRTIAVAKLIDPELKIKFADRSMSIERLAAHWKDKHVKMAGVNEVTAIMTPIMPEIASIKIKDDSAMLTFKGDTVDECLQWQDTNKIQSVNNGNVQYEKVCKKRGKAANDEPPTEVPAKYLSKSTKVGDKITIINKFPVVSWKAKKLTSLLGVALP